ncbi:transcription initiation factor TFIID subunit 5, partial [Lecanoromycetidae sp. Uapishka_2]
MSGQPPNVATSGARPTTNGIAGGSGSVAPSQQRHDAQAGPNMGNANINDKVIEYLSKKGYTRTESMLRMESANQDADGRPINTRSDDAGGPQYIRAFERAADDPRGLAVLLDRARSNEKHPGEDEGIPGHDPGSANTDGADGSSVLTKLKLGPMPMEPDLMADVRAELEEEDARQPPLEGQSSLVDHFEQRIKREESEDAPTRNEVQFPPSTSRDVAMEVQKVKEDRDRFKIEGKTGGVGPGVSVSMFTFHNTYDSAYVFTGSSDKTVRMWAVTNGSCVRMFTGHTGNLTSVACSPSGKLLASGDDAGTIIIWDLGKGHRKKLMRGHGKGGIWSLSWGAESTVLVSGGADGTVRLWDVESPNDASGQGRLISEGSAGQKIDGNASQMQAVTGAGTKKKGKDVVVTSDQISAFPTKKSPVYKVKFTRGNFVVAGGAYLP